MNLDRLLLPSCAVGLLVGVGVSPREANAAESGRPNPEVVESITVTGSRIERDGFEAPTPVTVLSSDELAMRSPSNIPDALNQLPQFLGSNNQFQNQTTRGDSPRSGNYLNLRALTPARLLVLQDGRRLPPTSATGAVAGAVDTNLIPQLLVERVDVVTGGASAAYGSDAISGVVNFVIDKDFEGLKGLAQGGISSRGDNESYRAALAGGLPLGRLHLLGSIEHYRNDGIAAKSDRRYGGDLCIAQGAGTQEIPLRGYCDVRYGNVAFGGLVLGGPLDYMQFLPDGQLAPFDRGTPIPGSLNQLGGDGAHFSPEMLTFASALETTQTYGRASFDFTDSINGYLEGTYVEASNWDTPVLDARTGPITTIYRENAYLSDAARAALGTDPSFRISRMLRDWGAKDTRAENRAVTLAAGLAGDIDATTHWDVSYSHGRTVLDGSVREGNIERYYASIDAITHPVTGEVVCRVTVTNPGRMDDCVPMNILGEGSPSQASIDYVRGLSEFRAINELDSLAANFSMQPFNSWAGPVSLAIGAEYREQSLRQTSNSDPAVGPDFTGIRGGTGTTRWFSTNVGLAEGDVNVKEAYLETVIPLAKDLPFADSLDLNAAYRYTDYSTSGEVGAWKLGVTYSPMPDLRIRATRSRDIRAPTLFNLFASRQSTSIPLSDPHTNQLRSSISVTEGNRDLKPEEADTTAVGIVYSPSWLDGLTFSVDYYDIKINDAIASPYLYWQIVDLCHASNGASPLCAQVIRPLPYSDRSPENFPTEVRLLNLNVAELSTRGLDLEVSYRTTLGAGDVTARALATYMDSYVQQLAPDQPAREYAGTHDLGVSNFGVLPKWRGNVSLNYARGPFNLNIQERYVGGLKRSTWQFVYEDNDVPAVFYTDLSMSYDFEHGSGNRVQMFLTINNLFDKMPPFVPERSQAPGIDYPGLRVIHDIVGTMFTAGFRLNF